MANISGKSYALTAFTRMRPSQTWKMRLGFMGVYYSLLPFPKWFRRMFSWTKLGKVRAVQEHLTSLSFIHFARWAIIPHDGFPRLAEDQPRESLGYDYMLFESNFNGDWEKYIDAFSTVIPGGMDDIWKFSEKYPKSRPITPFLAYIRNCQYDTDYYYNAYPGAATNDILGALKLQHELDQLSASSEKMTPAEFAAAYQRFCITVQNCIATTGAPPLPAEAPPVRIPSDARVPASSSTVPQRALS